MILLLKAAIVIIILIKVTIVSIISTWPLKEHRSVPAPSQHLRSLHLGVAAGAGDGRDGDDTGDQTPFPIGRNDTKKL